MKDKHNFFTEEAIKTIAEQHPDLVKVEDGEVYFHPCLFIDFAMWLDPEFEANAIKTCYNKLFKMEGTNNEN